MIEEIKLVRLCGFGGQGIVLAGTILGYAGVSDGKGVAGSNSYGAEARGGACRADVMISDKPISFPHIIKADILIAMYQRAYDRYIESVNNENGMVIYDQQLVDAREIVGLKQVGVMATSTAIKELNNKQVSTIVMLCAAAEITGIVSRDALIAAIEKNVKDRFKKLNLKAAELGFALGEAAA